MGFSDFWLSSYFLALALMIIKHRNGRVVVDVPDHKRNRLADLDLRYAVMSGLEGEGAILEGSNLDGADLSGADLYWAYAQGASFEGACLRGASLRGANLRDCNLRGADLRDADLSPSNVASRTELLGANLADADSTGANLSNAEYDEDTRFPSGFDPQRHGMVKVSRPPTPPGHRKRIRTG